ncbi:hypothetical protein Tco_0942233 [Tanacetum coccineum]
MIVWSLFDLGNYEDLCKSGIRACRIKRHGSIITQGRSEGKKKDYSNGRKKENTEINAEKKEKIIFLKKKEDGRFKENSGMQFGQENWSACRNIGLTRSDGIEIQKYYIDYLETLVSNYKAARSMDPTGGYEDEGKRRFKAYHSDGNLEGSMAEKEKGRVKHFGLTLEEEEEGKHKNKKKLHTYCARIDAQRIRFRLGSIFAIMRALNQGIAMSFEELRGSQPVFAPIQTNVMPENTETQRQHENEDINRVGNHLQAARQPDNGGNPGAMNSFSSMLLWILGGASSEGLNLFLSMFRNVRDHGQAYAESPRQENRATQTS